MNKLIKPIKSALSKKYGYKNVSVKNGRGTAWGWVEAYVNISKPEGCTCKENDPYCQVCRNLINQAHDEGRMLSYEAIKEAGLKFYTYFSDDGYGTERDEFLLTINLEQKI